MTTQHKPPGEYIRECRELADMSHADLAHALSITPAQVVAMELGAKPVQRDMVNRLASSVPGLSATRLRACMFDAAPLKVLLPHSTAAVRELADAFARKLAAGMSDDEARRLLEIIRG